MKERYASDNEYRTLFTTLRRKEVVERIKPGNKVLDIATGSAYFSIELAKRYSHTEITAIDIFDGSVKQAEINIDTGGLANRIKVFQMDASNMDFQPEFFDTVVNYLGLEDIHMTRGREGVENTYKEVIRVLKPGGWFYMVVMPSDEMETPAQKLEVEVFSHICQATWLNAIDYVQLLKDTGFQYKGKESFYTGLKLNVKQSKEEIKYACDNVQKNYGVIALDFEEVWEKYKSKIKLHGMGHYSKTVLMIAKKPE